jgi:hypothetical protein
MTGVAVWPLPKDPRAFCSLVRIVGPSQLASLVGEVVAVLFGEERTHPEHQRS